MDLIVNFLGLRSLLNESHHSLEFLFAASLESRRIVEDITWAALESERTTNIVNPPLQCRNQSSTLRKVQKPLIGHLRGRIELMMKR